jgi:ABC-2 type transport system permease protein
MGLREYQRTPVLLALLVGAPIYVIGLFSVVVPATEISLHLVSGATVTTDLAGVVGMYMTPLAGALIGGLTGLFVMRTTQEADARLVLADYRSHQVVLARLLLLGGIGVLVTIVSMTTLLLAGFTPELLGWFALATLLTTLIYGMIGILAGSILDTLSGVYLLLFVPMVDLFLFQNPLAAETHDIAVFLPGHFPLRAAMEAGFTTSVDFTTIGWGFVYLGVLSVFAIGAFYQSMRRSG